MTVTEIRNILESPYDRNVWKGFLQTQFTNNKLNAEDRTISLSDKTLSKQCLSLGNYEINEYTKIGIFEVELNEKVNITRNRVALRNLIKDLTKQVAGAMVVFVQGDKWRFSYISKRKIKNKDTNEIQDKETAPKRYTYLFGKGEKALTAAQRFDKLIEKQKANLFDLLALDDFEDAFSVDKLSKEFFGEYKEVYERFVEFITGKRYVKKGSKWTEIKTHEAHFQLRNYFDNDSKLARDFVKRMMGRIVFLYFIQKKGWLAVPKGKNWGEGNPDYLFELFDKAKYKDSFYSDYLVPLFFDTLNNPQVQKESNELRFPYLNGGLFDKTQDFKYDKLALPSEIFEKLFTTFNNYNFTIYEDAPDEHTVAVDPEMLGHIFENLLEDNKDKGAFYTPKDIVHYMCRESLHNYIYTYTQNENNQDFKNRLKQYNDTYDINLFGKDEIKQIDRALEDVKICDPAIGSGAFPMGLLHEIYNLKIPIEDQKGLKAKSPADLKKHIIEESIYGVDIDAGAVDIARLRFWLSLVVDEAEPQPLPNLAFKIVCANTLIPLGMDNTINIAGATEIVQQIEKLRHNYFDATKDAKKDLEREFKNLQNKLWNTAKDWVTSKDAALYQKLLEFNPFEDKSCSWFDPWWMFGVKEGFDIVIGNPPYVEVSNKEEKLFFKTNYTDYLSGHYDLYIFFFKKGIDILKNKGILAYITPHTFLHYSQFVNLRRRLLEKKLIILTEKITSVFENAVVDTAITFLKNSKSENNTTEILSVRYIQNKIEFVSSAILNRQELTEYSFDLNAIKKKNEFIQYTENSIPLGVITESSQGITVYAKVQGEKINYFRDKQTNEKNIKPFLKGRDFNKYSYNSELEQYIIYGSNLWCKRDDKYFESPKIFLRQTSDKLIATYIEQPFYAIDSVHSFIEKDKNFSLKYILAILNSKFGDYLYQLLINEDGKVFAQVKLTFVRQLPIKIISINKQAPFNTLVDYLLYLNDKETRQIFTHSANDRIASHIEDVLNMMVFELYFGEHMKKEGIDVLQFIKPNPIEDLKNPKDKEEVIQNFYLWYQKPENPVRQRMLLVETRSKDIIAVINKSIQ
jgi:adenine-specific DNA-methyltransferase